MWAAQQSGSWALRVGLKENLQDQPKPKLSVAEARALNLATKMFKQIRKTNYFTAKPLKACIGFTSPGAYLDS